MTKPLRVNVDDCKIDFAKNCDSTGTCRDNYGYKLFQEPWCSCQSCATNCTAPDFSQYLKPRTITSGVEPWTMTWTLGSVVILVILTSIWKYMRYGQQKKSPKSLRESIDLIEKFVKHNDPSQSVFNDISST